MNRLTNICLAVWLGVDAIRCLRAETSGPERPLDLIAGATLLILAACVLRRPPPSLSATSLRAWLLVLGSLLVPACFSLLPAQAPGTGTVLLRFLATLGFASSAVALRRHFSVLPQYRGLVTGGPYRLVRHPMYTSYLLLDATYCFPAGPGIFQFLWLLEVLLFALRAREEEACLQSAAPGYSAYARRTRWLLLPWVL